MVILFCALGGIDNAKRILKEIVILPTIRPEVPSIFDLKVVVIEIVLSGI